MVTEVTERALSHTQKREVLLTGGVAANKRLQTMMKIMAEEHDAKFQGLPPAIAIDNGVMIAWLGYLMYSTGQRMEIKDTMVDQHFRVEDVKVTWRN